MVSLTGVYVPERGDVVWVSPNPQAGREQAGRRPALVLSPSSYNLPVGLAVMCPITSRVKGYPFEVGLPAGLLVSGVVLADAVKNLDWRARRTDFIGAVSITMAAGGALGLGTNSGASWTQSSAAVTIKSTKPSLVATIAQLRVGFATPPVVKNVEYVLV